MLDKGLLLKISELDYNKIKHIEDSQLSNFSMTVNSFINDFPAQDEIVKTALKAKDYVALTMSLTLICDMLRQIYAEKLAEKCTVYFSKIGNVRYEDLQNFIIDFLKTVSALSIDLQMIEYQEHVPAKVPKQTPGIVQNPENKNTVLVVDDVSLFLMTTQKILQDAGYNVTCVNNGMAALNYLKTNQPILFILDIDMPEMNGYELAQKIIESGQNAPIIFLTGNAKQSSVVKAIEAGASDFILKPIEKNQLLERISKYIQPEFIK